MVRSIVSSIDEIVRIRNGERGESAFYARPASRLKLSLRIEG